MKEISKLIILLSCIVLTACNSVGSSGTPSNPTVQILGSINDATGVSLNSKVTLQFSSPVTGVSNTTLTWSSDSSSVPFNLESGANNTYTLSLESGVFLDPDTLYNVQVKNGITANVNHNEVSPTTFSFITAKPPTPTVNLTSPTPTTNVSITPTITLTFSESVFGVTTTTIQVQSQGGNPESTTIIASANSYTLRLSKPLLYITGYVVIVKTGLRSLATLAPVLPTTFNFTTANHTYQENILYNFAGGTDGAIPKAGLIEGNDGNFYGTTESGGNGYGTVFKITPQGMESPLYSFTGGDDGAIPTSRLIQASDGKLYGTTYQGGDGTYGTVFRITTAGVKTTLHSFAGGTTDGATPLAGLLQASDGNFYGTTYGGGNGYGTIFKITPQGAVTLLYSFYGGNDGDRPASEVIQGSDGNLYGTTQNGGGVNFNSGTVFQITLGGVETVLYRFAGGDDGAEPNGLIQASDGNFYGTTAGGGGFGYGTVFKITLAGVKTILYSFAGGTTDGEDPQGGLIQASDGNFYGTTVSWGIGGIYGYGTVFKITPQGQETGLYSFTGGTTDGALPYAGLLQASDGNFYGTTSVGGSFGSGANGYGTIFKITLQ